MLVLPKSKVGVLDSFCKLVEWTIFIGLAASSFYLTREVWDQYLSYDTNFKRSKEPVSDGPTMVINFWPAKNKATGKEFEFRKDFCLSFSIHGRSDKKILDKGIVMYEISDDTMNIEVKYEELLFPSDPRVKSYHKISSDFKSKSEWAAISVQFNESISTKNLPTVNIHITSEENAYGRYGDDYFEGQEISFVGLVDKEVWIKLQPEKYLFLDMSKNPKSQCKQNVSFYDSFDTLLMEEISKKCPMRCLPYISKNPHNSICKTEDEFDCAHDVFYKVKSNDSFLQKCTKSCNITSYNPTYEWEGNWNTLEGERSHEFVLYYALAKNEIFTYQEYLIQDVKSMIGSIGGTLGLFIGFSCSNVIRILICQFQNCIHRVISKKT